MILYHWGCQAAERLEPDLCFSSGDMGPGFYLTDDLVQARVLANIPNGGELTVVGTLEGWYVVQYGRLTGYAAAPYVKLRPGNIS